MKASTYPYNASAEAAETSQSRRNIKGILRLNHQSDCKMVAFTLAEVLITLGIIGVVAALTIPSVVNKFKQQVLNAQFKKVYSTLSNAHTLARYKWGTNPVCYYPYGNGGNSSGTTSDCAEFSELFLKELKIVKSCGNNAMQSGCIPQYKGWEVVKKDNNPDMSDDEIQNSMKGCSNLSTSSLKSYPAFILNDGSIIMPVMGRNAEVIAKNIAVDINGTKPPNKWGYDVFYFYTYFDGKNYILTNGVVGCMPLEKGGRTVEQMIKYVNSH